MSKELFFEMREQESLIEQVQNGNMNPLNAWSIADQIEKGAKRVKDGIKESTLNQIELENNFNGFDFSISSRIQWDFSEIKEITDLENKLKLAKEKYKLVYKSVEKGTAIIQGSKVVIAGGELVNCPKVTFTKPAPIMKKSK